MIVDDIEYVEDELELFPTGAVHDGLLARDTPVQGLPCAGGFAVVFYPSGRLKLAWLSSPRLISGVPCSANEVFYLHENGKLHNARLAQDCRIDGISLPAGTRATFDEYERMVEYSRQLQSDTLLGEFYCSALFNVWLYSTGNPSLVVLAAPVVLNGQQYPRGSELALNDDGTVARCGSADLDSTQRYKQKIHGAIEISFD